MIFFCLNNENTYRYISYIFYNSYLNYKFQNYLLKNNISILLFNSILILLQKNILCVHIISFLVDSQQDSACFWVSTWGTNGKFIVGNMVSLFLSPFSPSMFSRAIPYFRSNSSNISWGCLFIRREKFLPLSLQAIRFNSVRIDSIRRVVWLNSFRNKSREKRMREERDNPRNHWNETSSRLSGLL